MDRPTIGRIVHFVNFDGAHLPAIIVEVDEPSRAGINGPSAVTLNVFRPSSADPVKTHWHVLYDLHGAMETWHWPERS